MRRAFATWLAEWMPVLVPTPRLHRAAIRAGRRGDRRLAERLFDLTAARYIEEYQADALTRLRAHRRLMRQRAAGPGDAGPLERTADPNPLPNRV